MYYMAAHLRLHPGAAGARAPQEAGARGLFRAPGRVSTPEQPVRTATSGDRALAPAVGRSPQTGRSRLAFARMVRDTTFRAWRLEVEARGLRASARSGFACGGSRCNISPDGANVACSSAEPAPWRRARGSRARSCRRLSPAACRRSRCGEMADGSHGALGSIGAPPDAGPGLPVVAPWAGHARPLRGTRSRTYNAPLRFRRYCSNALRPPP